MTCTQWWPCGFSSHFVLLQWLFVLRFRLFMIRGILRSCLPCLPLRCICNVFSRAVHSCSIALSIIGISESLTQSFSSSCRSFVSFIFAVRFRLFILIKAESIFLCFSASVCSVSSFSWTPSLASLSADAITKTKTKQKLKFEREYL